MKLALRASASSRFRTAFVSAALVAAALVCTQTTAAVAAGSSAQSGTPTAPAASKPAAPAAASKPADAKSAAPKADAAEPTPRQVVPEPKALPPDLSGECAWTGKRIVSLLARDDVDQAKRFLEFYRLFSCKESHIAPTFRCVLNAEQENASAEEFTDRVERCWNEAE
jgi:hypothetical protein